MCSGTHRDTGRFGGLSARQGPTKRTVQLSCFGGSQSCPTSPRNWDPTGDAPGPGGSPQLPATHTHQALSPLLLAGSLSGLKVLM